jgi:hypothetical protein
VACAVVGFLIYGQTFYHVIGFYYADYSLTVSILLVLAHGCIPVLISIGVYHWLSAPRWEADYTRCGRCGYILSGLQEPRCSECGVAI